MDRIWICLALFAFAFGVTKAQNDESYPDYAYDDYWYSEEAEKLGIVDPDETKHNIDASVAYDDMLVPSDDKNDAVVEAEIEKFRKEIDKSKEETEEVADPLDEYQYEDNRSEPKEELIPNDDLEGVDENIVNDFPADNDERSKEKDDVENDEELAPEDDNKEIFEETKAILSENNNSNEFPDVDVKADQSLEKIFDETKQLLEAENSAFEESEPVEEVADEVEDQKEVNDDNNKADETENEEPNTEENLDQPDNVDNNYDSEEEPFDEIMNRIQSYEIGSFVEQKDEDKETSIASDENVYNDNTLDEVQHQDDDTQGRNDATEEVENVDGDENEDTVDKVYADLNEDLQKLLETWDKLSKDETEEKQVDDTAELDDEDVLSYEEKFGKPFREENVLKTREDYDNIAQSDYADIFKDETSLEEKQSAESDSAVEDSVIEQDSPNEYDNEEDDNQDNNDQDIDYQGAVANQDEQNDDQNVNDDATKDEYNSNDTSIEDKEKEILDDNNSETVEIAKTEANKQKTIQETSSVKTISVDELSPSQYDDLIRQFVETNKKELDPLSEDFARNVAPVRMTLSLDEPLIVTSPNYPNAYPANNIVDWIFEGEGMGIEFNLTDFAVNGNIGDYLLVKPGGLDESGSEGLIFTYTLNEPRRYRFLDVDQMFVRFQANMGLGFLRGFQFSVKMVAPQIEISTDLESVDPESLLPPPNATIAVTLGGLSPLEFTKYTEQFRQLVADMATMYINANNIEHGLNTTSETTQITSTSICNINWPDYESCVVVEFGIPLIYEDEETSRLTEDDLKDMWSMYIYQDPFALRLRRMGVTEFSIPDDGRVLLVWLVIAAVVVLSMAMLAFALWRFSCFEGYSRMPSFSDTDSIRDEKRNLDLYPTPHQTLPPLYADDYKWADGKFQDSARVDMGGFTNRSYARDELLDIDSDEEVRAPTDRHAGITARNIYNV